MARGVIVGGLGRPPVVCGDCDMLPELNSEPFAKAQARTSLHVSLITRLPFVQLFKCTRSPPPQDSTYIQLGIQDHTRTDHHLTDHGPCRCLLPRVRFSSPPCLLSECLLPSPSSSSSPSPSLPSLCFPSRLLFLLPFFLSRRA